MLFNKIIKQSKIYKLLKKSIINTKNKIKKKHEILNNNNTIKIYLNKFKKVKLHF